MHEERIFRLLYARENDSIKLNIYFFLFIGGSTGILIQHVATVAEKTCIYSQNAL